LELAAEQGHTGAQVAFANIYREGTSVQVNLEKARHYFQLAANQGNAEAHFNLGIL
jgi:TPR repeat protein